MKYLLASLVSILLSLNLIGCNTVAGMGKDMQQGGQELQKAANDKS